MAFRPANPNLSISTYSYSNLGNEHPSLNRNDEKVAWLHLTISGPTNLISRAIIPRSGKCIIQEEPDPTVLTIHIILDRCIAGEVTVNRQSLGHKKGKKNAEKIEEEWVFCTNKSGRSREEG